MSLSISKKERIGTYASNYSFLLKSNETVLIEYISLVITSEKMIVIHIKGKNKEYVIIPYSKVSSFGFETAGILGTGANIKIWVSGFGCVEISLMHADELASIVPILNNYIG